MSAFPGVSSYQSSSLGSKFVVIGVVCCQEMRGNALFHKVLRVLTKYLIRMINKNDEPPFLAARQLTLEKYHHFDRIRPVLLGAFLFRQVVNQLAD